MYELKRGDRGTGAKKAGTTIDYTCITVDGHNAAARPAN